MRLKADRHVDCQEDGMDKYAWPNKEGVLYCLLCLEHFDKGDRDARRKALVEHLRGHEPEKVEALGYPERLLKEESGGPVVKEADDERPDSVNALVIEDQM